MARTGARTPRIAQIMIDGTEDALLERIAELEAEIRALKAEVTILRAKAMPAGRETIATRSSLETMLRDSESSVSAVTADGEQGMRRGVSATASKSSRRGG